MGGTILQLVTYLAGAAIAGLLAGWLIRSALGKHQLSEFEDEWQSQVDSVARERDRRMAEITSLRTTIESQESRVHQAEMAVSRRETELASAREKEKRMSQDVFTLRAEREEFKNRVLEFQNALNVVKQQTMDLQSEFLKSREFYKSELQKAFEKRKALETKLDDARMEQESFANLLKSSRSEHDSVNKMLASAQNRLAHLDKLEDDVIRLEAENAQLNHDARLAKQEIEVLKRDVAELDQMRVQNEELAHCLQSMEDSRKQYEDDARRYREQADKSENKSETLQIRLEEVQKNFADIEIQQRKALKEARNAATNAPVNGHAAMQDQERDDLQEIVGIGKVFEKTLHKLGVFTFRQIATFGPADIARVNQELKECRGRMEQDDWIGQARDLHFKKYGSAGNH